MPDKWVAVVTAADGTVSVAGPFPDNESTERWSARLELGTEGGLSGIAVELESPDDYIAQVNL